MGNKWLAVYRNGDNWTNIFFSNVTMHLCLYLNDKGNTDVVFSIEMQCASYQIRLHGQES